MIDELFASERARVGMGLGLGSVVCGVFWWAIKKFFVTRADYEAARAKDREEMRKLTEAAQALAARVGELEKRVAELPTVDDISDLHLALSRVEGGQQAQQAQLNAMNHTLTLIQQHLLERRP